MRDGWEHICSVAADYWCEGYNWPSCSDELQIRNEEAGHHLPLEVQNVDQVRGYGWHNNASLPQHASKLAPTLLWTLL